MTTKTQTWLDLFAKHQVNLTRIVVNFGAHEDDEEWHEICHSSDPNKIGKFLQLAWEKAPDKAWIHSIPSWGILCDLCSDYCCGDC